MHSAIAVMLLTTGIVVACLGYPVAMLNFHPQRAAFAVILGAVMALIAIGMLI